MPSPALLAGIPKRGRCKRGQTQKGAISYWGNRWAFIPSHSRNQAGEPTVLMDSLSASPSTAMSETNRTSQQDAGEP